MRVTHYQNATVAKVKNKRIEIVKEDDGSVTLRVVRLADKIGPTCKTFEAKGKLLITEVYFSEEGLLEVFTALLHRQKTLLG